MRHEPVRIVDASIELDYGRVRTAGVALALVGGLVTVAWLVGGPSLLALLLGVGWLVSGIYLLGISHRNPRVVLTGEGLVQERGVLPWPATISVLYSSVESILLRTEDRLLILLLKDARGGHRLRALPLSRRNDMSLVSRRLRETVPRSVQIEVA